MSLIKPRCENSGLEWTSRLEYIIIIIIIIIIISTAFFFKTIAAFRVIA